MDLDLLSSPPGGAIDRDGEGNPTGILRERAVELVLSIIGKKSLEELKGFISDGLALCSRKGLTSVQTNDIAALEAYRELQRHDALPLRVFLTPNYDELFHDSDDDINSDSCASSAALVEKQIRPYRPNCMPASSAKVPESVIDGGTGLDARMNSRTTLPPAIIDTSTASSRLVVERVKIYADGSLGAETAALRTTGSPTETDPGYSGILTYSKESLQGMVSHARGLGLRVEVHAIGDAAAEQVSH